MFARSLAARATVLRTTHSGVLASVLSLLLTAAVLTPGPSPAAQDPAAQDIDAFFEDFTAEWVRADPNLATSSRYFGAGSSEQQQLEAQLTPETRDYDLQRIRRAQQGLRELDKFAAAKLSRTQRLSASLMRWLLEAVVKQEPYLDYSFPLNQFGGANVRLVETLTLRHPLSVPRDAENYLTRLALLDERMEQARADANDLAAQGLIPPRFIVAATLDSMRAFRQNEPAANPLVVVLAQKLANMEGVAAEERSRVLQRAESLVASEVYPAWDRAMALLETVLAKSSDAAGWWRFPKGEAAYANALARFTSTKLTANEIHEIGLAQVARIEKEMDVILRKLNRSEGTVRERMARLQQDLAYPDPTSDASRAQIMKDIDGFIADANQRSVALFARVPKTQVIAQPFPRFREAAAAANYNRAPFDGSRPAIFQMPLRPQRMTQLALRTLVYHETVPGHHLQGALEQENTELPRFRQSRALGGISAFSEGWALYAERLAVESGWYQDDLPGQLGQLSAEVFRARRLVVDTGLHAKRWTRQQAIDYGVEASEIDRYVVNPGQACAYMIGQLRILELRERAQQKLGKRFSLRDFHSVVLDTGTVPLTLLEEEIKDYISRVQRRGGK
jgi:uncharacterized protein (DUF885 family)